MTLHDRAAFPVTIRRAKAADAVATYRVFFRAVRDGTRAFYTEQQRRAWAAHQAMPPSWVSRITEQFTLVASREGRVVGFMSMGPSGYIDLGFVLPDHSRQGLGSRLYGQIEAEAISRNLPEMTTEASHLARPFFAKFGWQVITAQKLDRGGVAIDNFRMMKAL